MKDNDEGIGVLDPEVKDENKTEKPKMYNVILHNDDYTDPGLVVAILQRVFNIQEDGSMALMLQAHTTGKAVIGNFTKDIAETKCYQAIEIAKSVESPLLFTSEPE